ncbi:unnamed protein product, partial [Durusdinium trenchii]
RMHSGTRCVQCRKALTSSTAHSAQVMHRPVTVKGCLHGPFCPRCRRSVSRQVLPFCVCRALVENWLEMTVPTETLKPIVAQGPEKVAHTPARRPVETAARVTGATGKPGPGAPNPALASANFVSWDTFAVKPVQAATNGDSKLRGLPASNNVEALKRPLTNVAPNGGREATVSPLGANWHLAPGVIPESW